MDNDRAKNEFIDLKYSVTVAGHERCQTMVVLSASPGQQHHHADHRQDNQ